MASKASRGKTRHDRQAWVPVPPQPTLTLEQCAAQLKSALGPKAPAVSTLKRWSVSGQLDAAIARASPGGRPRYRFSAVLEAVKNRRPDAVGVAAGSGEQRTDDREPNARGIFQDGRDEDLPVRGSTPHVSHQPGTAHGPAPFDAAGLAAAISAQVSVQVAAQLRQILEPLAKAVSGVASAGANLEHTRKDLMLRYDARLQSASATIAAQKAEIDMLKSASNPIDLAKLNSLMSRVADRLQATGART